MEWGDNEYGQMGNKKRSGVMTPIVLKDFADKKVKGVFAGENKSGVIIEHEEWEILTFVVYILLLVNWKIYTIQLLIYIFHLRKSIKWKVISFK